VISIDGLLVFTDRLSRLDVQRTESDALERAACDIESVVKAMASPSANQFVADVRGRETAASAAIAHSMREHSVVIGAAGSMAVAREFGTATKAPDPLLSVAARQSAPAIVEHIGRMFAQLVSGL
jgi:hypothetical protein